VSDNTVSVAQALAAAHAAGLDQLNAQLLVLHAAGRASGDRAWLIAHDDAQLDSATFNALLARRHAGEPLAYITGQRGFFGLDLQVDRRVLDPRPDTETLVDWALDLPLAANARVLDLGTGSGAIALALAHARATWQVHASDLSADALAVARANAARLKLALQWHHGAWFAALATPGPRLEPFDLITSNPPYIAEGDPHLANLTHEPALALTSGADGLDAIRDISGHAPQHLKPGGWLLLEHGYNQAAAVAQLLAQHGFEHIQTRRDLGGNLRCTGGCLTMRG
jgi:release factor glutamine methyltransferase